MCIYIDDFGSIRVKDRQAYENLKAAGLAMDGDRYARWDSLASTRDLHRIFDVLTSVKDSQGHHACMTPFANVANPDFEKIRESGFRQYFREPFTETLKRYGPAYEGAYEMWKQGISENIFHPEYHGTEHINVKRFMERLQSGHRSTMLAFDNESVCVPRFEDEEKKNHDSTVFYIEKAEENEALKEDIRVGLKMFEDLLGYRSTQFTPGAGIYSPALHQTLKDEGIEYINVQRYMPYPMGEGRFVKRFLYNGKVNECGQKYVVRNCVFEPIPDNCSFNEGAAGICLKNIEAAFKMHAPAIVSTHRANFLGERDTVHQDFALAQLQQLLREIVKRWPDVEFMSGEEMCKTVF